MSDPLGAHDVVPYIPLLGYAAKYIADAFTARKQKLEDRIEADAIDANKEQDSMLRQILNGQNSIISDMRVMQKDLDALKSLPDKFTALEKDVAVLKSRPAGRIKR